MQNMELQKMNKMVKEAFLEYVNDLIRLNVWNDNKALIIHNCDMQAYSNISNIWNLLRENQYELLLNTLQSYEEALIHHDWLLQDKIEGLSIPKAYLFLKEIKDILENDVPDKEIEKELINRYKQIEISIENTI